MDNRDLFDLRAKQISEKWQKLWIKQGMPEPLIFYRTNSKLLFEDYEELYTIWLNIFSEE